MPKYFANKAEQLYAEAYALHVWLASMPNDNLQMERLVRRAHERVYRRYQKMQGAKC